MKKLLLILFVFIGFRSSAQIINIPDPNFKYYLVSQILLDTNGDHEIDSAEASVPTILEIEYRNIHDFTGINAFVNLAILKIHHELMTSIALDGLPKLTTLELNYNGQLASFSLNNLPLLNNVLCTNNSPNLSSLTSVSFNNLPALLQLTLTANKLSTLDLSALTNLRILFIGSNQFTALPDLSANPLLHTLNCGSNLMTSIDVSGRPNLEELNCNNSPLLTSFNIHNCVGLKYFYCTNNPGITSVDLTNHNLNSLQRVWFQYCALSSLNVVGMNTITLIDCTGNQFTEMDFSQNAGLTSLGFGYNPQLRAVNIKNGPAQIVHEYSAQAGCPNLQYICTDDDEASSVPFRPDISVNSYCSFTPGGFYNTINGTLKLDIDNNGCTAADPVLPGKKLKVTNGTVTTFTTADELGRYSFYSSTGNFTVSGILPNSYFNFIPASTIVNFVTPGGTVQTADFCVVPNGTHPDLDITLIPVSAARPGFNTSYQLIYSNKGTEILSGNVELNFDDSKMDFLNAVPAISTQSPGVLSWTYSNLQPFESRSIDVGFNLLPPPVNNNSDTLPFIANINPVAGDETVKDNSFALRQLVTGSFDPNDKTCLEGSAIDITRVGDYVNYLIRFQNTGTDTAFNVVVKDILSNKLDWTSFELVKTSHPCVVRQSNGNKLEFIFEHINLPDSNINEPGSHGFIAFKVKTIGTLSVSEQVTNNASIYFDFNLPVVTNTALFVIGSGIVIPLKVEYFRGAIQAGKHLLDWKVSCTGPQAIFDVERSTDGRNFSGIYHLTASNTRCLQPFDLTDNNPAAGINYYRIKMTDADGKVSFSSVIALLNKKAGFEIVNLLPNPVVGGSAVLNMTSAQKQSINIIVTDASGKTIRSISELANAGFTQLDMNFINLASGIYTITVHTSDGERKTKQFVKQ